MTKLKVSNQTGKVPTSSHIGEHDLGVNSADSELFINSGGNIKPIISPLKLLASAMTKADFDVLAEKRKRDSAGSGSLEYGKHFSNGSGYININEGLWSSNTETNRLYWGAESPANVDAKSRTFSPIQLVNGVRHRITNTNTNSVAQTNLIGFPAAPDGTKAYDSATGVVTQHGSSNEAFEGLCLNGDFRYGDDGSWNIGADFTITTGNMRANAPTAGGEAINQGTLCNKDIEYVLEFTIANTTGVNFGVYPHLFHSGGRYTFGSSTYLNSDGRYVLTIPAGTATADYNIGFFRASGHTGTQDIKNVSVMPVTESVITSRKDLVFLETWHEAIEDTNQVYYLGNVQYGGTNPYGIAQYTRNDGYTRFGEWDTATTGNYCNWLTMTNAEKIQFIQDPENNIYYDNETSQYIQVRYRIRVLEGLGDLWDTISPFGVIGSRFFDYAIQGGVHAKPQGSSETILPMGGGYPLYATKDNSASHPDAEFGIWGAMKSSSNQDDTRSHNGKCFALPICLVQRLNQGAYHPTYNPQGCRKFIDSTGTTSAFWHQPKQHETTSTNDCFNVTSVSDPDGHVAVGTGDISSTATGRVDQYDYYDAIYAGLVEDLRLNANKLDLNRLLEDSIRSDVAGTTRGKGRVPFTRCSTVDSVVNQAGRTLIRDGSNARSLYSIFGRIYDSIQLPEIYIKTLSGQTAQVDAISTDDMGDFYYLRGELSGDINAGDILCYHNFIELSAEYDSIPHVDIVGDPTNIQATFPYGVIGEWIPVIPTGAVLKFPFNKKVLQTSIQNIYTIDNGSTWSSVVSNPDNITNGFNFAMQANNVALWQYESLSDFTEPSINSKVLGRVGDVFAGNQYTTGGGNRLQPSLTGTIAIDSVGGFAPETLAVNRQKVTSSGVLHTVLTPEHTPLGLTTGNTGVKALMTLTEKDGWIYAQYHGTELVYELPTFNNVIDPTNFSPVAGEYYDIVYSESRVLMRCIMGQSNINFARYMIKSNGDVIDPTGAVTFQMWNGSGWGDDSTIPIVDNETTGTDLNGNTVKQFCHTGKIPLGIANYNEGGT